MSRQLEQVREDRQKAQDKAVLIAVEYGLEDAVRTSKREFYGFAAQYRGDGWLLTLKAGLGEDREIAFVGGETLGGALIKAVSLAGRDGLKWRKDVYVGQS